MMGKEICRHRRRTSTYYTSRRPRRTTWLLLQKQCRGGLFYLALCFIVCAVSLGSRIGVASAADLNHHVPHEPQHETTLRPEEDAESHNGLLDMLNDVQTRLLGKQKVDPSQSQKSTRTTTTTQSSRQQQTQTQSPPVVQGGISRKRTRRRALYELTIGAHYHPPPQTGLNTSLRPATAVSTSAGERQPRTLTPAVLQDNTPEEQCVFYNQKGEEEGDELLLSYWTYRLCPGTSVTQIHVDTTPPGVEVLMLPNGKITAEIIIPMEEGTALDETEFAALFQGLGDSLIEHNLGNFVVSNDKTNDEVDHLLKRHWDYLENISMEEMNEVTFYMGGKGCNVVTKNNVDVVDGAPKKTKVRRNRMTAVLYDTTCCTAEDLETQHNFFRTPFKISSVTET
eukprot:scaffold654361_cov59-Attheya_sp.AAC.1